MPVAVVYGWKPIKDRAVPIAGTAVAASHAEGDGNPAPVGLRISSGRTPRYRTFCVRTSRFSPISPYDIRTPKRKKRCVTPIFPFHPTVVTLSDAPNSAAWVLHCYYRSVLRASPSLFFCSFLYVYFQLTDGGKVPPSSEACHGTKSPDIKRGVPSLHLSRERRIDAHLDQPCQCAGPFPVRRSLASNPACAHSLVPSPCPCAASSFRSVTRAPFVRSEPLRVRCSLAPHPCPCPAASLSIVTPLLSLSLAVHSLDISRRAAPSLSLLVQLSRYLSPCLFVVATPRLCPLNRYLQHV